MLKQKDKTPSRFRRSLAPPPVSVKKKFWRANRTVKSLLELVAKQLIDFSFPFHDLTKATKGKFSEMERSGMHRMATSGITDNVPDFTRLFDHNAARRYHN